MSGDLPGGAEIRVVADGRASGDGAAGGWAAEITGAGHSEFLAGGTQGATTEGMALRAAAEGLRAAPGAGPVTVVTRLERVAAGFLAVAGGAAGDDPAFAGGLWGQIADAAGKRRVRCELAPADARRPLFSRVRGEADRMLRLAKPAGAEAAGRAAPAAPEGQAPPVSGGTLIYTDGSCLSNPGPGGWGAVVVRPGGVEEIQGSERHTTNNRMELRAAIESLRAVGKGEKVAVYTDSKYVQLGITEWHRGWIAKGWIDPQSGAADSEKLKNADLWLALIEQSAGRPITWHWVRGHDGDKYNEMAHNLAHGAASAASASAGEDALP